MSGIKETKLTESERILMGISSKLSTLITMIEAQSSILREIEKHSSDEKLVNQLMKSEIKDQAEILSTMINATKTHQPSLNERNLEKEYM